MKLSNIARGWATKVFPDGVPAKLIKKMTQHEEILRIMYPTEHCWDKGDLALLIADYKNENDIKE